jgi:hypothetical protein
LVTRQLKLAFVERAALEHEGRCSYLNSDFFIVAKPIPVEPNELPT